VELGRYTSLYCSVIRWKSPYWPGRPTGRIGIISAVEDTPVTVTRDLAADASDGVGQHKTGSGSIIEIQKPIPCYGA